MVSLSALIQRFSKDGTAPTGVRKHVGVTGAVTMTVSTVGGASYAKHPVPDRQTSPMPPGSPRSSTLAATPESVLKHRYGHSLSVNLYLPFEHQRELFPQTETCRITTTRDRDLNAHGRVAWGPLGLTVGGCPALTLLLTTVLSTLCHLLGPLPMNCQKTRWNDNEQYYLDWGQG